METGTSLKPDLDALTRIRSISTRILESGSMQPMLQEIMDAAVDIVGAQRGTLHLLEGDSLRIVSHHGHQKPFLDFFQSPQNMDSVCGEATRRGERVIVTDIEASPQYVGTPSLSVLRGAGVRAVQSTPIRSRAGDLLGILTTQWGIPHMPEEHDLWWLDLIARQAADMIERARVEDSLRKSERRYRQLFDTMTEGFLLIEMICDESGKPVSYRYLDANPALAVLAHLNPEEVIGKDVREVLPHIEPYWIEAFGRVAMTGRAENLEQFCQDLNAWYDVHVYCPEPGKAALIYTNTTGYKRTEAELRESRKKYQALIETTSDFIWEMDSLGRYTYCSPQMEELWGLKPEKMLGRSPFEMMPPESRIRAAELFSELLKSPLPFSGMESAAYDGQGHLIYIETSGVPFFDHEGNLLGFRGISRDMTERKQAELAILESENRFRTMADAIPQLAWIARADGWLIWYNRRWYQYTGTTPEQMEGWGWQLVHHPDDLPGVLERWKTSLVTGEPFDMIFRLKNAAGIYHPFLTRIMPVKDAAGNVLQWFGTNTDITEHQQAEEVLRRTAEELARYNRELEQFAYVCAHDLQEPLRQVRAFIRLLEARHADKLEGNAREYFRFVVEGSAHMSNLVSSLLAYSRLGGRLNRRSVPCREAIDGATNNLRAVVEEVNASIMCDDLPTVAADPDLLVTLFTNLIGNAIKFRLEGTRPVVCVGCRPEGRNWVFWVKDNGIGIDARYHEKVFLIFQRLHARARYAGTGIGLAICKKIVELHGGKIWVESKAGEGATFFFNLPEG